MADEPDPAAVRRAALDGLLPGVLADGVLDAGRLADLLDVPVVGLPDGRERYGLQWAGKQESVRAMRTPTRSALVPDLARSVGFDDARHVFIEGDNLEVLKLLQTAYQDKVKLIYLDPPYNTGNDFVYDDDFSDGLRGYLDYTGQLDAEGRRTSARSETAGRRHSRWLSMMYPRLLLARNLLTQDGLVAISIDDHELSRLTLMCDEVFGEDNFVATVVVQANKGGRDYLPLAKTHEYLLVYARNHALAEIHDLPKPGERMPLTDATGPYEARELRNRNPRFNRSNRPNLFYPFYVDPDTVDDHGYAAVSLTPAPGHTIETFPRNSQGLDSCWRWGMPRAADSIVPADPVRSQLVAKQVRTGGWNVYEKNRRSTVKAKTIWDETEVRTEAGTRLVREIFGSAVFDHPKPVDLVKKVVAIGTRPGGDDLVLDFFAGSGTTHHAVCRLNAEDGGRRRVISVNLPEDTATGSAAREAGFATVSEVTVARLRWVCDHVDGAGTAGLRVLRLGASGFRRSSDSDGLELTRSTLVASGVPGDAVAAEVLLQEGVGLDVRWDRVALAGAEVVLAGGVAVVLSDEIDDELVEAVLRLAPRVVVFLEDGFEGADAVKVNAFAMAARAGATMKTV